MNLGNYFRSFAFYNDRGNNFRHTLEKNEKERKTFRTLGYFDEFKTEKILIEQTNGDMDFLWERINLMNENLIDLNGSNFNDASFQNIFGFPCNYHLNDIHEVEDDIFWENNDYAYTFIILVQFFSSDENDISLKQKIIAYKSKFCENIDENLSQYKKKFFWDDRIKYPVTKDLKEGKLKTNYIITDYMTFDRYDYILSVKTNCYLPFVLAMQELYSLYSCDKKVPIALNSFTVTAIGKDDNLINELIPSICIKFNYDENNIFSYNLKMDNYKARFRVFEYLSYFDKQKLYTILFPNLKRDNDKHRLYYISGEDDVRVIAREVETKNLFKLFEEKSVLDTDYLYGFSTAINVLYDVGSEKEYDIQFDENGIEKEIRVCKELIHNLKEYPNELIKTLVQINSGLSAIRPSNPRYRGYGFYSLFVEFKNLLQLLAEFKGTPQKTLISKVFDVTHSFGSALLTTVRSDFREFQIPTFNANLYYAPTKMLVFYRAFIAKLIEFYNRFNEGSTEHFIINTGNEITTRVSETLSLTHSNGTLEKFFVCNMSERNIYMIKNSMIQLNHEVAHFGLRKIRNRKNRLNYIADSYLRAYVATFKFYLTNEISIKNELETYKTSKLLDYINGKSFNAFFLKKLRSFYLKTYSFEANNQNYMNETIDIIKTKIKNGQHEFAELISNNLLDFFASSIFDNINTVFQQYNLLKTIIDKSFYITGQALLLEQNDKQADTFDFFINYYFKESFADVAAILTLNLYPEDYFDTLLKGYDSSGKKKSIDNIVAQFRCFIVLQAFNRFIKTYKTESTEQNNYIFSWDIESFEKKFENGIVTDTVKSFYEYINDKQIDLASSWYDKKTVKFLNSLLHKYKSDGYEHASEFFSIFFYERNIFNNFVNYLVECIELFYINYDEIEIDKLNYPPFDIYKSISSEENRIDEKIVYIDSLLTNFEDMCSQKLFSSAPKKHKENS